MGWFWAEKNQRATASALPPSATPPVSCPSLRAHMFTDTFPSPVAQCTIQPLPPRFRRRKPLQQTRPRHVP